MDVLIKKSRVLEIIYVSERQRWFSSYEKKYCGLRAKKGGKVKGGST